MLAAREHVNIVLAVDADRSDLTIAPTSGQVPPVLDDLVSIVPGSDDRRHVHPPMDFSLWASVFGRQSRDSSSPSNALGLHRPTRRGPSKRKMLPAQR